MCGGRIYVGKYNFLGEFVLYMRVCVRAFVCMRKCVGRVWEVERRQHTTCSVVMKKVSARKTLSTSVSIYHVKYT